MQIYLKNRNNNWQINTSKPNKHKTNKMKNFKP